MDRGGRWTAGEVRRTRRGFLGAAAVLVLGGCADDSTRLPATSGSSTSSPGPAPSSTSTPPAARSQTLVVFYSRAGQNYDSRSETRSGTGRPITNLTVGNTEVLAGYWPICSRVIPTSSRRRIPTRARMTRPLPAMSANSTRTPARGSPIR